jgi:GntR family transcriptional regulator
MTATRVRTPEARRRPRLADADVRRLRDLLRSKVLRDTYPGGRLPAENELMTAYAVSRATVRQALALLRAEGLIASPSHAGIGSGAAAARNRVGGESRVEGLFNRRLRPRELERSVVPLPEAAAGRLGVAPGVPCLRVEYVALLADEPMAVATNYVLFPEAERLRAVPFGSDWYAMLDEAGIDVGESEFAFGRTPAEPVAPTDPVAAALLGGPPLITLEQLIRDPAGRAFDLAHIHSRGDRFLFTSRPLRRG